MHAFIKLLYCVNGLTILPVKSLRYTITAVHVLPNSHKKHKAFLWIVLFAPTLMPSHHLKNTFLRVTFCAGLQNNSSIQTSSAFFSEQPLAPIKANGIRRPLSKWKKLSMESGLQQHNTFELQTLLPVHSRAPSCEPGKCRPPGFLI